MTLRLGKHRRVAWLVTWLLITAVLVPGCATGHRVGLESLRMVSTRTGWAVTVGRGGPLGLARATDGGRAPRERRVLHRGRRMDYLVPAEPGMAGHLLDRRRRADLGAQGLGADGGRRRVGPGYGDPAARLGDAGLDAAAGRTGMAIFRTGGAGANCP